MGDKKKRDLFYSMLSFLTVRSILREKSKKKKAKDDDIILVTEKDWYISPGRDVGRRRGGGGGTYCNLSFLKRKMNKNLLWKYNGGVCLK